MAGKCRITAKRETEIRELVRSFAKVDSATLERDLATFITTLRESYSFHENKTSKSADTVAKAIVEEFTEVYKDSPEKIPYYINTSYLSELLSLSNEQIQSYNIDENTTVINSTAESRALVSNEFLYDAYGENKGLVSHVTNITNLHLFDVMFLDRGNLEGISSASERSSLYKNVRSTDALNRRLNAYLNLLFDRVRSYLLEQALTEEEREFLSDENDDYCWLYDSDNNYSGVLELPLWKEMISKYLMKKDISSIINDKYNTNNYTNDSLFEAYNAWVVLNNFDSYLLTLCPKVILIPTIMIGKRVSGMKYAISNNISSLNTNLIHSEDIDVLAQTNTIVKMAIETTPIYSWRDNICNGLYLKFNDWSRVITAVKDLIYNTAAHKEFNVASLLGSDALFSEETRALLQQQGFHSLSDLIASIPTNPHLILPAIFDILTDRRFYNNNKELYSSFNTDDMNKLLSINRGMFNGVKSLKVLQDPKGLLNFYNHLALSATSLYKNRLLLYFQDSMNNIRPLEMIDATIQSRYRSLLTKINSHNSKDLFDSWGTNALELGIVEATYTEADGTSLINITEGSPAIIRDLHTPSANIGNISLRIAIPDTEYVVDVNNRGLVNIYLGANGKTKALLSAGTDEALAAVKRYINKVLGIDLTTNTELYNILQEDYKENTLNDFVKMAARTVYNKFLLNCILKDETRIEPLLRKLTPTGKRLDLFYTTYLGNVNLLHFSDYAFAMGIATAMAVLDGVTRSSVSYDGAMNANNNYTFNRLYDSFKTLWHLLNRRLGSATSHFTIINNPGLIQGMYNMKEFYNIFNGTKQTVTMNSSELFTASFLHDFVSGLLPIDATRDDKRLVGNNKILIMPAVVSDKGLSGKLLIDLNTTDANGVKLANYSRELWITAIRTELGEYYQKMRDNVSAELNKLLPYLNHPDAPEISNLEEFNQFARSVLNRVPIEVMEDLITEYNEAHPNDPISLIDLTHYRVDKEGNLLGNPVIAGQIDLYSSDEKCEQFFSKKEKEIALLLLDNDFSVDLTDRTLNYNSYLADNYSSWVSSQGNMTLCKVTAPSGEVVNISSAYDAYRAFGDNWYDVITNSTVELHPLIARYNLLDHFISLEFLNSTVGSFTNHPFKGDTMEARIASLIDNLNKRNLSLSSPLLSMTLNTLNGVSDRYKIAVIEELFDRKGTVNGLIFAINGMDGATFVNPFTVLLENNSLGGNSVAVTKKPFIHGYNPATGTGILVKTSSFGFTNSSLRDSLLELAMMKKMTDRAWRDHEGNLFLTDVSTDNILTYKNMFYKEGEKYYQIISIRRADVIKNDYDVRIQEVDEEGNPLMDDEGVESPITVKHYNNINSNYKLWKMFGGDQSMAITNGILDYADTSIENVVEAMNTITIDLLNGASSSSLLRFYLPLKHSDINYLCTKSAVKQGAANVNRAVRFHDNKPLNYFEIDAYNMGILLDKEADIDEDDVANGTLAIAAAALRLYTNNICYNLYNALSNLSSLNTETHLKAVADILAAPDDATFINNFRQVLRNSMLEMTRRNSNSYTDFTKSITRGIIARSQATGSPKELPYSDDSLYHKVHNAINNYFTNLGIRIRRPGVLSILIPSYGIMRLYGDKKLSHVTDTYLIERLADFDANPVYARSVEGEEKGNISDLKLDRTYKIQYSTEIAPTTLYVDIEAYHVLREAVNRGEVSSIVELVWDEVEEKPVGRDLASYNVRFSTTDGKRFLLYDLDSVRTLFLIEKIISQKGNSFEAIALKFNALYTLVKENTVLRNAFLYKHSLNSYEKISNTLAYTASIVRVGRALLNAVSSYLTDTQTITPILQEAYTLLYNGTQTPPNLNAYAPTDVSRILNNTVNALRVKYREQITEKTQLQIINTTDQLALILRTITRRWKLFDQNNLSVENYERRDGYDALVREIRELEEPDPTLYLRYANSVNIKFGLRDGDSLKSFNATDKTFGSKSKEITDKQSFENADAFVSQWMAGLTKVRIDGLEYEVDRNTLEISPYEIIAPNRWREEFGLSTNTDVNAIVSDPDYFIKQLVQNQGTKMDAKNFSVEFKSFNGRHIYVIDKHQISDALTKVDSPYFMEEDGKRYRVTFLGEKLYEVYNGDTESPDEIYRDSLGREVIATNLSESAAFYMDNLGYNAIRLSRSLLSDTSLFDIVRAAIDSSSSEGAEELSHYLASIKDPTKETSAELVIQAIDDYIKPDANSGFIRNAGRKMHTAFLRLLEIFASRTPGLSLLSSMAMTIAAFTERDVNTTYVSTMQNLLLGSDFDIDTTSLNYFDVNRDGTIPLWSPYANTLSIEMFKASERLPLPTGVRMDSTEIESTGTSQEVVSFFRKYKDLFSFIPDPDVETHARVTLKKINTPLQMTLLADFLSHASKIRKPIVEEGVYNDVIKEINNLYRTEKVMNVIPRDYEINDYVEIFDNIYQLIISIANRHNTYLNDMSRYKRNKIFNNYLLSNLIHLIADPANLTLSLQSTDYIVGEYKDVANNTSIALKTKQLGEGNIFAKFILYQDAHVGKQDVGISAAGVKIAGGISLYVGDTLRKGSDAERLRLLLKRYDPKTGEFTYVTNKMFANAYVNDPFTITDARLTKALATVNNDTDFGLTLAAFVSLSADNAKDPILSKLNAGTKTMGMYIYGALMGEDFPNITKLLTSKIGLYCTKMLEDNVFTGTSNFTNAYQLRDYFTKTLSRRLLSKYDTTKNPNSPEDFLYLSPLSIYEVSFKRSFSDLIRDYRKYLNDYKNSHPYDADKVNRDLKMLPDEGKIDYTDAGELYNLLGRITFIKGFCNSKGVEDSRGIKEKILDGVRNSINMLNADFLNSRYKQLCDTIENYVYTLDTIFKTNSDKDTLYRILDLAAGAEEMRVLGQIYSVNLGVKSGGLDFIRQIDNIESSIYNRKRILGLKASAEDMLDIERFAFDPEYRETKIQEYENVKHSINILAAAVSSPHYETYLKCLAAAVRENRLSFKFRNTRSLLLLLRTQEGNVNINKIIPGIERYINNFLCNRWMRESGLTITIPEGNKVFEFFIDASGKTVRQHKTNTAVDVMLGTDIGNASFKMLMEQVIIPDLKSRYTDNKFLLRLTPLSVNNTVLGNPTTVYSLDIQMMPRNDAEDALLREYKQEFNKMNSYDPYEIVFNNGLGVLKIAVSDLFVLYTMIAHDWRMGLSSLKPFMESLYGTHDLVNEFHDFESYYDNEGRDLDLSEIEDDIRPYIINSGNPYTSRAKYLKIFNRNSRLYDIYRLIESYTRTYNDEENAFEEDVMMDELMYESMASDGYYDNTGNIIGNYRRIEPSAPYNYFQRGVARESTHSFEAEEEISLPNGTTEKLHVSFETDLLNGIAAMEGKRLTKVSDIRINNLPVTEALKAAGCTDKQIEKITNMRVPLVKINGRVEADTLKIVDNIKNLKYKC